MKKLLGVFLSLLLTFSLGISVKADDENLDANNGEDTPLIQDDITQDYEDLEADDIVQDDIISTNEDGSTVDNIEEKQDFLTVEDNTTEEDQIDDSSTETIVEEPLEENNNLEFEVTEEDELLASNNYTTGLYLLSDGHFYYYENGVWVKNAYKYVDYNGGKFLVANGVVATHVSGLAHDPNTKDDWYYLSNGQVQNQYTGLAFYDNEWFYVENGKLATKYAGYVDYDGGKFYVGAGKIMTSVNGLAQDPTTGEWYYCSQGQAQLQYTGLAFYDGDWFYVIEGKFYDDAYGYTVYDSALMYIEAGQPVYDVYADIINEQVNYTNEFRVEVGEEPLELDIGLCMAAYERSSEMAENNLLSHTRPNGTNCLTVLLEYGILYGYAGENIAYGYNNAYDVSYGWKNSSGHYANMIDGDFNKIGVGYENDSNGRTYWTQLFTD